MAGAYVLLTVTQSIRATFPKYFLRCFLPYEDEQENEQRKGVKNNWGYFWGYQPF